MRILWVKAGKILPVDTGGRIRSFHILRALAHREQVTFLSYYGGRRDAEYEAAISREIPGTITIHTGAAETKAGQALDYSWNLHKPAPYAVTKFTNARVRQRIADWYAEGRFDVHVCDFLSASLNFPSTLSAPTVLFQHNVESALWQRVAATETHPVKRHFFKIEASKMLRYERSALQRFHHVVAVSENDRGQMRGMSPSCPITVVPTGVDCTEFTVAPPSRTPPERIVFVGSMDWEPNIDAVTYFAAEIWPSIRNQFPQATFEIVGRNPHPKVQRLASDSIKVTGTVPAVTDYFREATIVVVPLRAGGGTRLKIFEAMAMGKAVVSTSIGAEGLDVQSGRDLILADTSAAFIDSITMLLRDEGTRHKYEQAAAKLASQYDWSRIGEHFLSVLEQTVALHRAQSKNSGPVPVHS